MTTDGMNLHPPVSDSVKVMNLTHSMGSFMSKIVPPRLLSNSTSFPKSYLLDHLANQICRLERHKEDCCSLPPPKI
ncbi:unnamed protein product [Hymenolepis diminuta]|uniref:Uncharacterized protein n=1 Tax=Hymenolepis diminuta TaxID=6216 RepID=A0A564Z2J3_HYMDI|nr:unnamed protein product [Hymenolepis diminuta]